MDDWQRRVDAFWETADLEDAGGSVAAMTALVAELPADDPRGPFELGGVCDSVGREAEAAGHYERALGLGLDPGRTAQLTIQYASTLRNLGRAPEAVALLRQMAPHPDVGAAREAFLALALHSTGHGDEALQVALTALAGSLPRYQRAVRAYAEVLPAAVGPDDAARGSAPS